MGAGEVANYNVAITSAITVPARCSATKMEQVVAKYPAAVCRNGRPLFP